MERSIWQSLRALSHRNHHRTAKTSTISKPMALPAEDLPCENCRRRTILDRIEGDKPCRTCGATLNFTSMYLMPSHTRLVEQPGVSYPTRIWALGSERILKEIHSSPNYDRSAELRAVELLREKTNVPIPSTTDHWVAEGVLFITQTSLPGESLLKRMRAGTVTPADLADIALQVAGYVEQWRSSLQSDKCANLEGRPVKSRPKSLTHYPAAPTSVCDSDQAIWEQMFLPAVQVPWIPPETLQFLRETMPSCTPFVFSHLDLTPRNIMVQGNVVTGLANFDHCAYWPSWFEQLAATSHSTDEEFEFYEHGQLHRHEALGGSGHAKAWWTYWTVLQSQKTLAAVLQELEEELTEMTGMKLQPAKPVRGR